MTSPLPSRFSLKPGRAYIIISVILGTFVTLVFRLFHLQIIDHDYFLHLRDRQSLTVKRVVGERGIIYDVKGIPLAFSIPSISVYARPKRVRDPERTAVQLEKLTGVNAAE